MSIVLRIFTNLSIPDCEGKESGMLNGGERSPNNVEFKSFIGDIPQIAVARVFKLLCGESVVGVLATVGTI